MLKCFLLCHQYLVAPTHSFLWWARKGKGETFSTQKISLIRSVFRRGSCEISDEGGLTQQRAYGEGKGVQQEAVGRDTEEQCYSAPFPF